MTNRMFQLKTKELKGSPEIREDKISFSSPIHEMLTHRDFGSTKCGFSGKNKTYPQVVHSFI